MKKFTIFLIYSILMGVLQASRIPFAVPTNEDVEETLQFDIMLPNKDILQVDLLVKLMKNKNNTTVHSHEESTTTPLPTTSPNDNRTYDDEPTMVTVKEAIEAFRQELIKKEADIAGIIESKTPFYRHFQLEHGDNKVRIRCTYTSNYQYRTLNIQCFEYKTVSEQRMLSNGQLEYVDTEETGAGSDMEFIDVTKYKQTLNMNIS